MEPTFELTAVYATNIFGIVLLAVLMAGNAWRFREKGAENAYLQLLLFFTLCTCIIDPIAFTADGRQGTIARILVYGSNDLLYLTNMFSCFFWLLFLAEHQNYHFSNAHRNVLGFAIVLGLVLVILNNFVPIIFDVSTYNVYTRKYFWIYHIIDYGILLDSIIIYFICKHKGGPLKSFPIWIFFFPIIAGTIAQSLFYGISVISSSTAIAIAGAFSSIHGERVYRDKLTNVFNYAYLAILSHEYKKKKNLHITGILVNINGFKKINSDYGRVTGNKILVQTTKILKRAVGELGIIIRYSSDEFIAFINTTNEMAVSMCITRIRAGLNDINTFSKSYKLSTCICSQSYDPSKTMDDFIDEITRAMQEEKTSYYTQQQYSHREVSE
ncbi:MAG: diguanylate cyclase [Fibrobacter sp.]|nr:diguanylate cyclase [Fibrobacter sp.]